MKFLNKLKDSLKDFDIVKNLKKFLIISGSIILAGILVIIIFGLNLGIDFTGGTVLNIKIGSQLEQAGVYDNYTNQIETILQNNGLSLSLKQQEGEDENAYITIRFQDIDGYSEEDMGTVITTIKTQIVSALSLTEDQVEDAQRIGPSASATLLLNALLAVLVATILILIYIAFRFELLSGLSAILALVHDVLMMTALVAIFQIQVNSSYIAAVITIIGYSINNTIVIFDRVRENRQKDSYKEKSNAYVVNISIRESLKRTLNSSFTTLITITILAIISVPSIREFAVPIIFGLIAGMYSSILIATPVWAFINDRTRPRNKKAKTLANKKENTETKEILQV